jgi:methylmalonyl-CoA/ethylmalonyl-CoA epimerase
LIKKGEGIHHIAYEVDDIYQEMERLKAEGFEILNKEPKHGADNKLIFFLHPKSTNGVLVELCQERTKLRYEREVRLKIASYNLKI